MKKVKFKRMLVTAMLVVSAMMFTGCIGSASKPATFYMLHSMPEARKNLGQMGGEKTVSVLIGPVTLPTYLGRTQMVTVAGKHELLLDEFNRWAEPLKDNFYRVLMENLSSLLNTAEIYTYDRDGSTVGDYQVIIDVTHFLGAPGGEVCLTAFWRIAGGEDGKPLLRRKSVFCSPASTTDTAEMVEAQNKTLTDFSREIAGAIQAMER